MFNNIAKPIFSTAADYVMGPDNMATYYRNREIENRVNDYFKKADAEAKQRLKDNEKAKKEKYASRR